MNSVVFEFKSMPLYGLFGLSSGHSITAYDDGSVVRREYLWGKEEPCTEEMIAKIPALAEKLKHILVKNEHVLISIPHNLNNRILDGMLDDFIFDKKKISSTSTSRTDLEEMRIEILIIMTNTKRT